MKKLSFTLIVILLVSIIITLIGYNELTIRQNNKKYQELIQQESKNINTKTSDSITINCIGDSFAVGDSKTSLANALASQTNFSVNKFGGYYDQSIDIAIRMGSVKVYTNNVTIPSNSSPVHIKLYNKDGEELDVLKSSGSNFSSVEIDGISGKLKYDQETKDHTFTRDQNGEQKNINNLTQITAQFPEYNEDDIAIIFSGTYDPQISNGIFRTITYQRAMLNKLNTKRYIVVSLTSKRKMPIVRDMNKVLAEEHDKHFLDYRSYLLENGLEDANITPTKQDELDLENGYIPTSLLKDDKVNGNSKFNQLLAEQIIKKMIELEYIDEQLLN